MAWLSTLMTAAGQGWKAGVAVVNITPKESIWLAGYAIRTRPSEGVRQELHAKALALQDEAGAVSVMLTADLLGFSREMAARVSEQAQKKFGLARERLLLNASHTHSGPVTGHLARPIYDLKERDIEVIDRYTTGLLAQVVEVIGASIQNLSPASLAFGQGMAGVAVNRRRVQRRELPGPVDPDVPVLTVRGSDGTLRAVVFGYSCHATVLDDYQINGDWPGYAQESLEKVHPGTTVLFLNGCGADANPLPRRSVDLAHKYGEILAAAVDRVLEQKMTPLSGPLTPIFDLVEIPFERPPSKQELQSRLQDHEPMNRRHAQLLLDRLNRDGKLPSEYAYPIQIWRFGRSLKLIALGGEVVVDYALRFKALYGWTDTWVAGYSNDVFAYIPSLRVLREGGYEGGGAMIPYGQPGPFGAAVEETIAGRVDELLRRTTPAVQP